LWDDIRDTSGKPRFTGVRAFRYYPLLPKPEAVGLVGTANGDVVLAQQRVGNGLVFTSGIAFDPKTSNLPLRSSFLAIIHSMVLMTNLPRPNILDLVAGERIVLPAGLVQLSTIAGSSLEWRGKHSDLFTLPRSGIYRAAVGTNITHIVVRFSPAESDPRYIENAPVPVLDGLSHRIVAHDGVEDLAKTIRRQRAGLHFFAPLLALAILVTILEGLVANPAPVPMVGHWFGRWRHATSRFSLGR
ncbi:MAG: hypothetical protein N2255_09355, partial [Kiritimatiellae bacterium]|nr:hypothetical protein [Kiritimatiellia bacterium]